jgi:CheY-like chemotaxis protein
MSEKLLVADDSPTIQKVVGITLANTDYETVQAQSEEELMEKLNSDSFDLVLLDFNLSENSDGYELCQKVREVAPNQKIMIMLGTFDTVDEYRLEELGVVERVIKPFESSKFIKKIKDSLEVESTEENFSGDTFSDFEENNPFEPSQSSDDVTSFSSESGDDDLEDDWAISGPQVEEDDEPMPEGNFLEEGHQDSLANELASEVKGWGMSVPEIIGGEQKSDALMPEAIGAIHSASQPETISIDELSNEDATGEWDASELVDEESTALPDEDDLGYPDLSSSSNAPSSSLVSLDELSGSEDEEEEELEQTDPQIVIEQQEDSPDLAQELAQEVEAEDFWAADESYDADQEQEIEGIKIGPDEGEGAEIEQHSPIEIGPKLEDESHSPIVEALNDLHEREEEFNLGGSDPSEASVSSIDKNEIISALREEFRPLLKEMVREVIEEMGKETSEKIAWEIIPDLAENLIRAEVEKLSQKVQDKHSLN